MKMYHEGMSEDFLSTIQEIFNSQGQLEVAGKYFFIQGFSIINAYYNKYDIELHLREALKEEKKEIPNEFDFIVDTDPTPVYHAIRNGDDYDVSWGNGTVTVDYTVEDVVRYYGECWKPLPPETEAEKQIKHVIKLTQQDIEHKQRMIANYEANLKELQVERLKGGV